MDDDRAVTIRLDLAEAPPDALTIDALTTGRCRVQPHHGERPSMTTVSQAVLQTTAASRGVRWRSHPAKMTEGGMRHPADSKGDRRILLWSTVRGAVGERQALFLAARERGSQAEAADDHQRADRPVRQAAPSERSAAAGARDPEGPCPDVSRLTSAAPSAQCLPVSSRGGGRERS